jgi:hypothetical protein
LDEGRKVMDANQRQALHLREGEGKMLWVVDELMTFKASGEDTGGAYSLTDSVVPREVVRRPTFTTGRTRHFGC